MISESYLYKPYKGEYRNFRGTTYSFDPRSGEGVYVYVLGDHHVLLASETS